MRRQQPVDSSVIGNAPTDIELGDGELSNALESAYNEIGYLTDELAQTRAELEKVNGGLTIEQVKAGLIKPYANKVFWFVAVYCAAVGCFSIADGNSQNNFDLAETTIGIIAGSTAVSVIGLIGMVISGLFGSFNS